MNLPEGSCRRDPSAPDLQVCAAGALLSILHREGLLHSPAGTSLAAPDRDDASLADSALRRRKEADMHFCVESLSELHLLGHLCVDSASMHALQIFQVHAQSALLSPDISIIRGADSSCHAGDCIVLETWGKQGRACSPKFRPKCMCHCSCTQIHMGTSVINLLMSIAWQCRRSTIPQQWA